MLLQYLKNIFLNRCWIFILGGLLIGAPTWGVPIQIGGTDYLKPAFAKVIKQLEEESTLTENFLVQLSGTTPARRGLESGNLEIAAIFGIDGLPGEVDGYERLPLGYQIVQVIVHENNPLDAIRVNRLTGIFGLAEEFDFNRWGDLGLGEWADRTMDTYYVSGEVDLSTEYFRHRVMVNPEFKLSAVELQSRSSLLDSLRSEVNAIGISGYLGSGIQGVKPLALSSDATETPIAPDPESVHFGSYPLRIPLFLYYQTELNDRIRAFLVQCYSEPFRQSLVDAGIMPLPRSVNDRILLDVSLGKN